ncbi:MAG: 50S ribosomal protein L30 [Symbiobacteriaceae bacterium]|nr:50S ribosomal protein L30 [Symbiobacteriaceae bacterium]
MNQLKITLVRGFGGKPDKQRKIAHALGLYRKEQVVYREDSPVTRGMIAKISHLLKVEPHEGEIGRVGE